jgi:hypothetical protein
MIDTMTILNPIQHVKENRTADRAAVRLKAVVQVKESDQDVWKEMVELLTVSKNGAGFQLSRPVAIGRLVSIVCPMPAELRAYDLDSDVYPVLGLVQYCNSSTVDGKTMFHVGVGFIGKQLPDSYRSDPTQGYRINGMRPDGLWTITESAADFKKRRDARYWISIPVSISLVRRSDREDTITTNLSASGASVVCSLDVAVGEKVKFACKDINFYSIAVVRNRRVADGQATTIHVQFETPNFPVERIRQAQAGM